MSRTPEDWLEDGFELAWPEYIPRKDYQRAIEMVVQLGGALRGIKRPPPMSEESEAQEPARNINQKKHTRYVEVIRELLEQGEYTTAQLSAKTLCHIGTAWNIVKQLRPKPRIVGQTSKGGKVYTLRSQQPAAVKPPSAKPARGWNRTVREKAKRVEELIRNGPISTLDIAKAAGAVPSYVGRVARAIGASKEMRGSEAVWHMNGVSPT